MIVEAQCLDLADEFVVERTLTENIQREGLSRRPGLCQHLKEVAVVLDKVEIANGDEIPEALGAPRRGIQRRHEIADDCGRNRRGLRKPTEESLSRPLGDIHDAVDLGNYLAFSPPDPLEHGPATCDLLFVGPLVGL